MGDIFSNPAVASIVMVFAIPIVGIIAGVWADVAKNRDLAELKRSMVNRGMSADEITQVINAGTKKDKQKS